MLTKLNKEGERKKCAVWKLGTVKRRERKGKVFLGFLVVCAEGASE